MGAPDPKVRSVNNIKSKLLQPALTSHFECFFAVPSTFSSARQGTAKSFIGKSVPVGSDLDLLLTLSCSDATLPGSQLATHELNNDFTGVAQKHAYRRLYDDRADFTFYVNHTYTQIRFFERWIQYIVGEQEATADRLNIYYRMNYPKTYKTTIYITKFERNIGKPNKAPLEATPNSTNKITYSFFNAFPISVTSVPVSYETSQLLKYTVSFAYDRYIIKNAAGTNSASEPSPPATATGVPNPFNLTPERTAEINNIAFNGGFDFGPSGSNLFNNSSPNQFNQQTNLGVGANDLGGTTSNIA